jgi:polysaccharide deacetylase family protein (PEP-CTERM system associated)
MNQIALSFDLEFWYNSELLKKELSSVDIGAFDDRVILQTEKIIELLKNNNAHATFFVLGKLAEKYPALIKSVADAGHEIASHGYSHTALPKLTPESFETEIIKSKTILESITGKSVTGFRAPAFSLTPATSWAIPILIKHGFKYDSSIFPSRLSHYGHGTALLEPYRISADNIYHSDTASRLLEIPTAIIQYFHIRIPISGGIYFRALPYWLFRVLLRKHLATRPALLYFHPHEFDTTITSYVPSSPMEYKKKLLYMNYSSASAKLANLLHDFNGVSIEKYYDIV